MKDGLENFKKQHLENYKLAVIEIIKNNTNVLIDEDIMLLIKKPPLDSMDVIKTKFLDLAKKNKVVLDTETLDKILDEYRLNLEKNCEEIRKIRIDGLNQIIKNFEKDKDVEILKIRKQDLAIINKKIRKLLKENIKEYVNTYIVNNISNVFSSVEDQTKLKKITSDITKFVGNSYQKQFLDNVDFKLLVKDTTLINGVKEQGERYVFTLENSRLFKNNLGN